eukprot:g4049.t1
MKRGNRLFEVQFANLHNFPTSWFVGNTVTSEGSIYVCTRIDPLFLLLSLFECSRENGKYFTPLDQIFDSNFEEVISCESLRPSLICDVNEVLGPEQPLYRLNEVKALAWLQRKVARVASELSIMAARDEKDLQTLNGIAGIVSTFHTGNDAPYTVVKKEETNQENNDLSPEFYRSSFALVAEYLSTAWATKLYEALGEKVGTNTDTANQKKDTKIGSKRGWNVQDENVDALQYTIAPKRHKSALGECTSSKTKQRSAAQKKLAKTNIKGMKKMMFFFKNS